MLWTDEEIRELITLWPSSSTAQLALRLHRPRAAIAGKVKRLRQEGALPRDVIKHFEVKPVQARPPGRAGVAQWRGATGVVTIPPPPIAVAEFRRPLAAASYLRDVPHRQC